MDKLIQQQERIIRLIEKIALKMEATEVNNDDFPLIGQEWSSSPEQTLPDETGRRDGSPPTDDEENRSKLRRLKLYRASLNGDWKVAESIFYDYREDIRIRISKNGDTALHIATGAKHIDFVKELVKIMYGEELAIVNNLGQTALFLAAVSGEVQTAKEIIKKNREIAMIVDYCGTLPIHMAASLGHKDMVNYLYEETKNFLGEKDREELFVSAIEIDLYDFALQLLNDYPHLATARAAARYDDERGVTALHVLARKLPSLYNRNQRSLFERFFSLGAEDVENKRRQALDLVKLIWKRVILLDDEEISYLIAKPRKLIFDAAERGNIEFLSILIGEYPDLILKVDTAENYYSIFHYAVKERHKDVFKLIYEIGATKDIILTSKDIQGNNILHLAGMMRPTDAPGPALQMQSELLWFQEVEKVVQPRFAEARNKDGLTPRELFTMKHEALRDKGEKWMKDTAGSCMVVATLITGVAFAAAFTVPGGNNGDTGFPLFLAKVSFKIFAISDAISLVSSSVSILNFLSIFTSSCEEEDFRWWLPRQLRLGLAALFISIAAMMAVFSTTFFIVFNDARLWIAILVTAIASTPVIMFIRQHFTLFYEVVRSTQVSHALFQQGKSKLFRRGEKTSILFREEKEASDQRQNAHLQSQYPCSTNV